MFFVTTYIYLSALYNADVILWTTYFVCFNIKHQNNQKLPQILNKTNPKIDFFVFSTVSLPLSSLCDDW